MKTRQEIKALARESVAMQRDRAILIPFLIGICVIAASFVLTLIPVIGWLLSIAVSCISMVLGVNINKSFYKIYNRRNVEISEPFKDVGFNFFRKLGGSWWMALWIALWSMITIIPGYIIIFVTAAAQMASNFSYGFYGAYDSVGSDFAGILILIIALIPLMYLPGIIKSYHYFFATHILGVHPQVSATQALKLSMRITKGHRWELFVMHLSFIGWILLSLLTFGILYIVYVGPYMTATASGFFTEMRNEAIMTGRVNAFELGPDDLDAPPPPPQYAPPPPSYNPPPPSN